MRFLVVTRVRIDPHCDAISKKFNKVKLAMLGVCGTIWEEDEEVKYVDDIYWGQNRKKTNK